MSSRIRQIREYLALQEEIARRLRSPIDLDRAALDSEGLGRQMIEDDQNSLIPIGGETIEDLVNALHGPSLADRALQKAYRTNVQEQLQEARDGGGQVSGPMIASVMQLDR
jgi:hypothetical protein